jgi:porphobilinogen synthase
MVQETRLSVSNLIYPMFIAPGQNVKQAINSLPGQYRFSVDLAVSEAKSAAELGIPAILLFGLPTDKDPEGSGSYDDNGTVQQAIRAIKQAVPQLTVITDVCLCSYTDHGHCGPLHTCGMTTTVDNDATLDILGKIAVSHAKAGADVVAPSGMIDGMIAAMRFALDEQGYEHTSILSYTAKYASSFYGPFREAADSTPQTGDRKSYQMNPANAREAIREAELDVSEGADMLMVKPALAYLDIIALLKQQFDLPLAAYNVSGEYSLIKAAAEKGWVDEKAMALESLLAMKRAGADLIITYWAKDAARWLAELPR